MRSAVYGQLVSSETLRRPYSLDSVMQLSVVLEIETLA